MPKILLTNDDGWDAPGIATLKEVLKSFGDVTVVAPATPQSGISHQMTFEVPMALTRYADRAWHLTGTPADCTRVGMTQLDEDFDWVFSGINNGGNLGVDNFVSGTVAAAREATFFNARAVAISQHRLNFPAPFDWQKSKLLAQRVVGQLFEKSEVAPREVVSINLPDCTQRDVEEVAIVECARDSNPLPYDYQTSLNSSVQGDPNFGQRGANAVSQSDEALEVRQLVYRGKYNDRLRSPGSDIDVCLGGNISLTRESSS